MLNKFAKGPLVNVVYQTSRVLRKIFECFSLCFYDSNLGPPRAGPFSTLRPSFEQTW